MTSSLTWTLYLRCLRGAIDAPERSGGRGGPGLFWFHISKMLGSCIYVYTATRMRFEREFPLELRLHTSSRKSQGGGSCVSRLACQIDSDIQVVHRPGSIPIKFREKQPCALRMTLLGYLLRIPSKKTRKCSHSFITFGHPWSVRILSLPSART